MPNRECFYLEEAMRNIQRSAFDLVAVGRIVGQRGIDGGQVDPEVLSESARAS